jgi:phage-related minor tail protein
MTPSSIKTKTTSSGSSKGRSNSQYFAPIFQEELERCKQEQASTEEIHSKTLASLRQELEDERKKQPQGNLTVSLQDKHEERVTQLEADARRLMDQNIALTAENTSLMADLA